MKQSPGSEKLIASNPNARHNYFIEETVEAGLVLTGTEVKSLRQSAPNIRDSFVDIQKSHGTLEAFLLHTHIAPYTHGNIWNHEPLRKRKLLLHSHEIERLFSALTREGFTLVPLRLYFKSGRVKVEVGLGKGKKRHDKREDLKKRNVNREMDQAKKRDRNG
jgi:SsrA-binding protein